MDDVAEDVDEERREPVVLFDGRRFSARRPSIRRLRRQYAGRRHEKSGYCKCRYERPHIIVSDWSRGTERPAAVLCRNVSATAETSDGGRLPLAAMRAWAGSGDKPAGERNISKCVGRRIRRWCFVARPPASGSRLCGSVADVAAAVSDVVKNDHPYDRLHVRTVAEHVTVAAARAGINPRSLRKSSHVVRVGLRMRSLRRMSMHRGPGMRMAAARRQKRPVLMSAPSRRTLLRDWDVLVYCSLTEEEGCRNMRGELVVRRK